MKIQHPYIPFVSLAILGLISAASLHAATFAISSGTDTTAKTLAAGESGSVASGATLSLSGSTVAITLSGTSGTATITNSGSILQTGTGRVVRNNSSGTPSFNITNNSGALIRSADADTLRADVAGSNWTVNNTGTISSLNGSRGGNQAIDFDAVTTGTVSITNSSGGQILAYAADAIRPGANATINNAGTISASLYNLDAAPSSDGIDTQVRSGVNITNTGTISGRHAITGGDAALSTYSITVTNNVGGVITGVNGSGINIDGVFTTATANVTNAYGATIQGNVSSLFANGDGDGVDIDGVLTLNNSGNIFGYGAKGVGSDTLANNAQAVSIGGGSITNTSTGQIIGSSLFADAPDGDTSRAGEGILVDNSSGGNAIAATTVDNSGLIRGKTGAAIRIVGTFADTVTNNSGGTIRGAGTGAAIQTGDGGDTLNNAGTITGDNGQAIDLGAGNDTLTVTSGSITGDIDGGTGTNTATITPGAGNTFSYAGSLSNFSSVEISTGNVILSGASTYSGNTTVTGNLTVTNSTGSATGTGSVMVSSGGTLGGTGHVGNVSLASGGTLAPGLSPGTLNIDGNLDLVGGSYLAFELGSISDLLNISGALNFTGGGTAIFDIFDTGSLTSGADYTLMNYDSQSGLSLANLAFGSTPAGFSGAFTIGANSLTLHVDAAPEPSRALLGALGLAFITLRRRRKVRESISA